MFRSKKTHSQVMMTELSEGFDHLSQAAAAAADGVNATVGPKWKSTRQAVEPGVRRAGQAATGLGAAVSAMALKASGDAQQRFGKTSGKSRKSRKAAKQAHSRRWMMWAGLAGAGAAAGTAGALAARRRRRAQWDEYDAQASLDLAAQDTAAIVDASRGDSTVTGTAKAPQPEGTDLSGSSQNNRTQ